ncbi:tetratricopeptide repeat protein [Deinococcus sp. JMULE3]|uniref:tetratricopeptide repeat protein n=1 Tax=Deinococcus sp. JMULE3 TaxID=2518341 RepID=UPI0015762CAA|nr:tetratricopeptide repeat protein [Deinococcus sp. JMULE3]NTY02621.1 tetratricopeptide repeat protein [Deinococcus sp. JMULE3]
MSDFQQYLDAHALLLGGRYQAALDFLDARPVVEELNHARQRAYALHSLRRTGEAYPEIERAAHLAETLYPRQRSAVYIDWAVMLMRDQRFDEGFRLYHQALAHAILPEERVTTLYNLGWTYLRRGHLDHALDALQEGYALTRASRIETVRWRTHNFRCALALHARASGQFDLALQRARQATRLAGDDRAGTYAWNVLATTLRLAGQDAAARAAQERALSLAGDGAARDTEALYLALIDLGGPNAAVARDALQRLAPLTAPYDGWRARLHLAQDHLRAGEGEVALAVLHAALDANEPYVLLDEAPVLGDLYAHGRAAGLILPTPAARQPCTLHVTSRGEPGARLCGAPLPGARPLGLAVVAYLRREGPATLDTLAAALLDLRAGDRRGPARIRAAISDLHDLTGSDTLTVTRRRTVTLDPDWVITTDLDDPGPAPFSDLYGAWVTDLAR